MPIVASFLRHLQLVARDMEGRAFPSVGCLYLDQTILPLRREAGDVIAQAVAILLRYPSDAPGEVVSAMRVQSRALMVKHTLFSGVSQGAVALIASGGVEAAGDALHLFQLVRRRCIPEGGGYADKNR